MTLSDMKRTGVALLLAVTWTAPAVIIAQAGQTAATVAKTLQHAIPPPTSVMSAATKTMIAARAARTAAMNATRQAGGAAASAALGRVSSVVGYLVTPNGALGNATVQLRNTVTGAITQSVKTDVAGQFLFTNVDSGQYVVEYAQSSMKDLVELSHPFTAAPGEVATTIVRLTNQVTVLVPSLATNIATDAVQAAATAGVTTVATPIAPVVETPPPASTAPPTEVVPPAVSIPPAVSSIK